MPAPRIEKHAKNTVEEFFEYFEQFKIDMAWFISEQGKRTEECSKMLATVGMHDVNAAIVGQKLTANIGILENTIAQLTSVMNTLFVFEKPLEELKFVDKQDSDKLRLICNFFAKKEFAKFCDILHFISLSAQPFCVAHADYNNAMRDAKSKDLDKLAEEYDKLTVDIEREILKPSQFVSRMPMLLGEIATFLAKEGQKDNQKELVAWSEIFSELYNLVATKSKSDTSIAKPSDKPQTDVNAPKNWSEVTKRVESIERLVEAIPLILAYHESKERRVKHIFDSEDLDSSIPQTSSMSSISSLSSLAASPPLAPTRSLPKLPISSPVVSTTVGVATISPSLPLPGGEFVEKRKFSGGPAPTFRSQSHKIEIRKGSCPAAPNSEFWTSKAQTPASVTVSGLAAQLASQLSFHLPGEIPTLVKK